MDASGAPGSIGLYIGAGHDATPLLLPSFMGRCDSVLLVDVARSPRLVHATLQSVVRQLRAAGVRFFGPRAVRAAAINSALSPFPARLCSCLCPRAGRRGFCERTRFSEWPESEDGRPDPAPSGLRWEMVVAGKPVVYAFGVSAAQLARTQPGLLAATRVLWIDGFMPWVDDETGRLQPEGDVARRLLSSSLEEVFLQDSPWMYDWATQWLPASGVRIRPVCARLWFGPDIGVHSWGDCYVYGDGERGWLPVPFDRLERMVIGDGQGADGRPPKPLRSQTAQQSGAKVAEQEGSGGTESEQESSSGTDSEQESSSGTSGSKSLRQTHC
jgi:hypothetical protein